MKKYLIVTLVLFSVICKSQITFQKTFGSTNSDAGNFVRQTNDGGYIISGYATDFIAGANRDIYLIKTDANGNIQWNKTYGSTNDEFANCVQQTIDGGYIIAGNCNLSGVLIKINSNGDTLWTKTYIKPNHNNTFYSVWQTNDGGYIIAGDATSGALNVAFLLRVDNIGNILWANEYSVNTFSDFKSVQQTNDGGYIACGTYANSPTMYLLKINSAGSVSWYKLYNYAGSIYAGAHSIQQTSDGGYIIGGDGYTNPTGYSCIFKTDATGNITWSKKFIGGGTSSIQQTSNGGYIAALSLPGSAGQYAYVLKLDGLGNFISSKQYTPNGINILFNCIQQANDGGFIIVGNIANNNNDIYLIKTDTSGESNCNDLTYLMSSNGTASISTAYVPSSTPVIFTTGSLSSIYINNPPTIVSTLCSSVGISQLSNNSTSVKIYPNPTKETLNITNAENSDISIYNLLGEMVLNTSSNTNNKTLDVSNLSEGTYIIKIIKEKEVVTKKLIISK